MNSSQIYYHGGGHVINNVETYDEVCAEFAIHVSIIIIIIIINFLTGIFSTISV